MYTLKKFAYYAAGSAMVAGWFIIMVFLSSVILGVLT